MVMTDALFSQTFLLTHLPCYKFFCVCLIRRIQVHPRGFKEGKDKSFSVYLVGGEFVNNVPHVANTYAMFKLRVLDQVNRNHFESRGMLKIY